MATDNYIYQDRGVVFLDVLGFADKLVEFQQQAEASNSGTGVENLISEKANEFITIFKDAVGLLDNTDYRYYLFSDNICITIDYVGDHNRLIDVLITINDLFFKFAAKGYFLRGGLDVGKFVDEEDIAVGLPLAKAYKLEQEVAVFPRIVLSENYKKKLDDFEQSKSISEDSIVKKNYLVKNHCEVYYLNTFFNLLNNEDKISLLTRMKSSISDNLTSNALKERVAIKYEWLVQEFNDFIDEYVAELYQIETVYVADENEIETIKQLKFT